MSPETPTLPMFGAALGAGAGRGSRATWSLFLGGEYIVVTFRESSWRYHRYIPNYNNYVIYIYIIIKNKIILYCGLFAMLLLLYTYDIP